MRKKIPISFYMNIIFKIILGIIITIILLAVIIPISVNQVNNERRLAEAEEYQGQLIRFK